ncbi:hypothetical protein [Polynucleobacter sp.]|uniref:hypothetical protein n=1 Tax=Polynucleobacter sp. TaxID=2029855 RepID=UPI003F69E9B1
MIKINFSASVVDYAFARHVIHALGYGATRIKEELVIYPSRYCNSQTLYVRPGSNDQISALFVDEGMFSYCLCEEGLLPYNKPWMELVDFQQLLSLIVKRYSPEFRPEPSPFMGRGRTQDYLIHAYSTEIKRILDEEPHSDMANHFEFE